MKIYFRALPWEKHFPQHLNGYGKSDVLQYLAAEARSWRRQQCVSREKVFRGLRARFASLFSGKSIQYFSQMFHGEIVCRFN
jgi:hypothetical protein